ncbi:MAG: AAA family ATPase, partial [Thermoplasmata archaeon]
MSRFPQRFVNRERELSVLLKALKKAKEGEGTTILITGELGAGKTRLAEEFGEICRKAGFTVLSSLCIGPQQPAYHPVLTALQNYAKNLGQRGEKYVPLGLVGFQSFEIEERGLESVIRERTRAMEYLLRQFIAIAREEPLVFIIDDLHLADSATLAFLTYLARNIKNERIITIATFVEEYAHTKTFFAETLRNMNIERLYTLIKLGNLTEKEILEIVLEEDFTCVEEIARYIYERTSGNPLFIVEFLATIRSSGLKNVDEIKKLALPTTVRDIIHLRVSKLEETTKKVLSICAVLGRVFDYAVLAELSDLKEEELLDAIDSLISQNFLVEAEEYEEGYKFVNNAIHEVVYNSILRVRRKLLHQRAAEIIEQHHGKEEKFWGALAKHYKEANNRQKFLEYAIKAGRSAAKKYANA